MMMEATACLGENHPEYDEDDDNIVASYSEPISKTNQRVFGRARNAFPRNLYGRCFPHRKSRRGEVLDKIAPCGLFWNIYDGLGRDWLKMLSIGQVWLDVFLTQRRVTRL